MAKGYLPGNSRCSECGASYDIPGDSCAARFDSLLALDHSRREPWGSRHGLAFAVYALQHAGRFPKTTLEQAWRILHRVYIAGDEPARVLGALAGRAPSASDAWNVPPIPAAPPGSPAITIADLGAFEAAEYVALLDAWARATMAWWSAAVIA
ncbi:MAG TPA: DUF5946 family protein [Gemmatimonadaceae bacterium]